MTRTLFRICSPSRARRNIVKPWLSILFITFFVLLSGQSVAAGCSPYLGKATLNEFFKDQANQSNDPDDFAEVKILDGTITSAIFDNWTIQMCEDDEPGNNNDADGCSGAVPLSSFTEKTLPWLVLKNGTIGRYINFKTGFDAILLDENGDVIDYLTVSGYNPQEDAGCTGASLAYDYQADSPGASDKTIFRSPDGTGDWDSAPSAAADPTEDNTNDEDPNGDPAPVISVVDVTVNKGVTAIFTFTLQGAPKSYDVTVNYETLNATAVAGTDYIYKTGTATIPAGNFTTTVSINTIASSPSGIVYFYLYLSDPVNATVANHYPTGTILAPPSAEWYMDESVWNNTAGEVNDSSSNNNHGTAYNDLTTTGGYLCNGGNFDGLNDYIQIPHNSSLNGTSGLTYSAWIKPDTWAGNILVGNRRQVMGKSVHQDNAQMGIFSDAGVLVGRAETVAGQHQVTTSLPVTGGWTHVALVFSANELRLYINGSPAAGSVFSSTTLVQTTAPLMIGRRYQTGFFSFFNNYNFDGLIDEVLVMQSALPASFIATMYNNYQSGLNWDGTARSCPGQLNNFAIDVGAGAASTCTPKNITVTARDSSNQTYTGYTGTISLTTSSSHGDWGQGTATNVPNNGTSDDGAATYLFDSNDQGSITLTLSNSHADDLTITVTDAAGGVTSTSAVLSFRDNAFVITDQDSTPATDVLVAGRDEAMRAALWRRDPSTGDCAIATAYSGVKNLKAWLTTDASHPAAATLPAIGALTLPVVTPGANNLNLNFNAGVADFLFSSSDVGKYVLNLRDDSSGFVKDQNNNPLSIDGSSNSLITRPFALGFTNIRSGATNNPGGTASSGAGFVAAGTNFQATVAGYLWQAADDDSSAGANVANDGIPDDDDGDGIPDALITDNGKTLRFAWDTGLSSSAPFTPTGAGSVLATLSVTNPLLADYAAGEVTKTDFSYPEVGSLTLRAQAVDFLNTAGVNVNGYSPVVGRFYPDSFTLESGASLIPGCSATFTYMGQPFTAISFDIRARNAGNAVTTNYDTNRGYNVGTLLMEAENNDDGVDLSSRMSNPTGTWSAGNISINSSSEVFIRNLSGTADGPFSALAIGLAVNDPDNAGIANRDMNPATSGDCTTVPNCSSVTLATTDVRYGRLRLLNSYGSELSPLRLPIRAEYYNGTDFVENTDDSCTTYNSANVSLALYTDNLNSGEVTASGSGTLVSGRENAGSPITLHLPADSSKGPGLGNEGSVNVLYNTDAWLEYNWGIDCDGDSINDNDACAKATFGIYRGDDRVIYWREVFD